MQTPQAFRRDVLVRAHATGDDATDDAALVEAIGGGSSWCRVKLHNVKITEPGDLANGLVDRVAFDEDRSRHRRPSLQRRPRACRCGSASSRFRTRLASLGHSDADVATHALCDALLGAANSVTSAVIFPTPIREFEGASSRRLLVETVALVRRPACAPISADITIVAERPQACRVHGRRCPTNSPLSWARRYGEGDDGRGSRCLGSRRRDRRHRHRTLGRVT